MEMLWMLTDMLGHWYPTQKVVAAVVVAKFPNRELCCYLGPVYLDSQFMAGGRWSNNKRNSRLNKERRMAMPFPSLVVCSLKIYFVTLVDVVPTLPAASKALLVIK